MKRRPSLILLVLAALAASAGRSHALIIVQYSLPDLAARAEVIAEGQVTVENGAPFLNVREVLKGNPAERLRLVSRSIGFTEPAKFTQGESVVVFIENVDPAGNATLVGCGDQGKWPGSRGSTWFRPTYRTVSLEAFKNVVNRTQHALSGKDFEEQGRRIVEMLRSNDEVLQLAGLETALSRTLNERIPVSLRGPAQERLAAFSLPLLASRNGDVRSASIRLMGSAPNAVAAKALVPLLADADPYNRRLAVIALGRVWANGKVADPVLPEHLATMEGANAAVEAANQKWNAIRAKSQAIELPLLPKSLS